jgi:hypothetical protein
MLGWGQQNKGNGAGCAVTSLTGARTSLTGAQTGLTASSRVSQNKSKPKMVKLKNLRLVLGKQLNLKAVISIKEKNRSLMRNFRLPLKDK